MSSTALPERQWRTYRLVAKRPQSALITLFEWVTEAFPCAYQPGQYLSFKLPHSVTTTGVALLRQYSIVEWIEKNGQIHVQVAVKHERAPDAHPEWVDGVGSSYFHQHVQVGDELMAVGPMGEFVLQTGSMRPVVLLSGGVGATPLLAMLAQLAQEGARRVHYIHACENGVHHAFYEQVTAFVAKQPHLIQQHIAYRSPTEADRSLGRFDVEGLLNKAALQRWLCLDDYEWYLCGPTPFMHAMWAVLAELGVRSERIYYEFFGPVQPLGGGLNPAVAPVVNSTNAPMLESVSATRALTTEYEHDERQPEPASQAQHVVQFGADQPEVLWQEGAQQSLLELAESVGLEPNFSCRSGVCNSCMCTLVSGEVQYTEEPLDELPPNKILLCCAQPLSPKVVVELD